MGLDTLSTNGVGTTEVRAAGQRVAQEHAAWEGKLHELGLFSLRKKKGKDDRGGSNQCLLPPNAWLGEDRAREELKRKTTKAQVAPRKIPVISKEENSSQ